MKRKMLLLHLEANGTLTKLLDSALLLLFFDIKSWSGLRLEHVLVSLGAVWTTTRERSCDVLSQMVKTLTSPKNEMGRSSAK